MVLVDTSVWIAFLGRGNSRLGELLEEGLVVSHPFVLGELACGNIRNRRAVLELLGVLPEARVAEHLEVLRLVDQHKLYGRGLGWTDMHVLAAAMLSGCSLWTFDKALDHAAQRLGIAAGLPGLGKK